MFKSRKKLKEEIITLEGNLTLKNKEMAKVSREFNKLKDKNEELLKKLDELEIDLNLEKVKEVEFKEKINCLEKEKIEILCNLEKNMEELNKAILKIKDLEDKLKESMTDKYLVKKLPSGRKPKGQRIGSKASVASKSNILKYMKEEEQN